MPSCTGVYAEGDGPVGATLRGAVTFGLILDWETTSQEWNQASKIPWPPSSLCKLRQGLPTDWSKLRAKGQKAGWCGLFRSAGSVTQQRAEVRRMTDNQHTHPLLTSLLSISTSVCSWGQSPHVASQWYSQLSQAGTVTCGLHSPFCPWCLHCRWGTANAC